MHVALTGLMAEHYVADLREKTKRGQRGRVLSGKTAGGHGYGYVVGEPGERLIIEEQADIVRRVFSEFASGLGPRAIARGLNADGIPGPKGKIWKASTLRGYRTRGTGLLNNQAYIGELVYWRTSYVKDPSTGKKVARVQPEENWLTEPVPELRIIDDDLWKAVKDRQDRVATEMPRDENGNALNRVHRKKHVLSGLVRCGVCGGPMAITARNRYGCSTYRSSRTCTNSRTVLREEVETRVLSGLKSYLLDADLVGEFLGAYEAEVKRNREKQKTTQRTREKRMAKLEREIERLVDAIVQGVNTPSIDERLKKLEAEKADLQVLGVEHEHNVISMPNIAKVYEAKVRSLMDGLTTPSLRQEAIELIQSMIESVMVTPLPDGFDIDVHGELGTILSIVDQNDVSVRSERSAGVL